MIVDSSALIAIVLDERQAEQLRDAMLTAATVVIPAPVLTEVWLVTRRHADERHERAEVLIRALVLMGAEVAPFEHSHADITAIARDLYGKGNGKGGLLNFGDLMVYAIAKQTGLPLLCTGSDFASTDLVLHPASRLTP